MNMPISVDDVATLETYLQGVINRSEHHAETVGAIALALLGAVLWRKDGKPLEVRRYAGEPANIVWFEVDGNRYALAYNHGVGCIELRERTQSGKVRHRFTNKTSVIEVREVFQAL
jgi:hypothetical protein